MCIHFDFSSYLVMYPWAWRLFIHMPRLWLFDTLAVETASCQCLNRILHLERHILHSTALVQHSAVLCCSSETQGTSACGHWSCQEYYSICLLSRQQWLFVLNPLMTTYSAGQQDKWLVTCVLLYCYSLKKDCCVSDFVCAWWLYGWSEISTVTVACDTGLCTFRSVWGLWVSMSTCSFASPGSENVSQR